MQGADPVLTAAQLRAAEQALIDAGSSVEALMEQAGSGAAEWIWRVACGRPVTVVCGPGNNGGDGYVIARILSRRGLPVAVIAPRPPATPAARAACSAWGGGPVAADEARGGVLVDCLFGSGLSRPLAPEDEALLDGLGRRHDVNVAVDLPSGVAVDSAELLGQGLKYDLTLALGAWKPAHFLMPAMAGMGALRLVPLGVEAPAHAGLLLPPPLLSAPPPDAHKYSRGFLAVVAGVMPGAALLAAEAAMRAGAGYVKLLADTRPDAMPSGLVVDERALSDKRLRALLIGPGLGRDDNARERLSAVLERGLPTVIDADALHLLDDDLLEGIDRTRVVITPHAGELDALCETFAVAPGSKPSRASGLAKATGLTVLAKGPDNVLAAPDGRLGFFPPAPSWLSVAGSGDVLAGIAASRLAAHADAFAAAHEAVHLHSEAARIAGPAFTADDLAAKVSVAYARFL